MNLHLHNDFASINATFDNQQLVDYTINCATQPRAKSIIEYVLTSTTSKQYSIKSLKRELQFILNAIEDINTSTYPLFNRNSVV